MKIYIHKYKLEPLKKLNAISRLDRLGCLLKVEYSPGVFGYADIHPWEELGDASLEDLLFELKSSSEPKNPLLKQSLFFAQLDYELKLSEKSYFTDLKCLVNMSSPSFKKFKMGVNLVNEVKELKEFIDENPKIKIRLDFNEFLSLKQFELWWKENIDLKPFIEFIEDPCGQIRKDWQFLEKELLVPLAQDLKSESDEVIADIVVIKPAKISLDFTNKLTQKKVITHYMDHPLGQLTGAFYFQQLDKKNLLEPSLVFFKGYKERHEFSYFFNFETIGRPGFGVDKIMDILTWELL